MEMIVSHYNSYYHSQAEAVTMSIIILNAPRHYTL